MNIKYSNPNFKIKYSTPNFKIKYFTPNFKIQHNIIASWASFRVNTARTGSSDSQLEAKQWHSLSHIYIYNIDARNSVEL